MIFGALPVERTNELKAEWTRELANLKRLRLKRIGLKTSRDDATECDNHIYAQQVKVNELALAFANHCGYGTCEILNDGILNDLGNCLSRNLQKPQNPQYFSFDVGRLRRPVLPDKSDRERVSEILKVIIKEKYPANDKTFSGRVGIYMVNDKPDGRLVVEPKIQRRIDLSTLWVDSVVSG